MLGLKINKHLMFSAAAIVWIGVGCSKTQESSPGPVQDVKTTVTRDGLPTPRPNSASPSSAVAVQQTVSKSQLLGPTFLYGLDLQFSARFPQADQTNAAIVVGHIPVHFVVNGNEVQMIAEEARLFPSDIVKPNRLISRFPILAETADSLVLGAGVSSVYLAEIASQFTGNSDSGRLSLADHWVRSLEFDSKDQTWLQETSILTSNGFVFEFMESIIPVEQLAAGADFKPMWFSAAESTWVSHWGERFWFFISEYIHTPGDTGGFVSKFDLSKTARNPDGTIDWYVSSNIPPEYIPSVETAILGWNRYYLNLSGINREVMRFKGVLPAGRKIGDPRLNVVVWDSVLDAEAAWESQASSPFSGVQSHSLIYLPAAWLTIGRNEYESGAGTLPAKVQPVLKDRLGVQRKCNRNIRDLRAQALAAVDRGQMTSDVDFGGVNGVIGQALAALGIVAASPLSPDEVVARDLLKQTLFHEVGHALGLGHNFAGSLSFDPDKNTGKQSFSDSIMDYNQFLIERAAFSATDTWQGPSLEYDRQAISILYNQGQDVKATDPVLFSCTDEQIDSQDLGVDPWCARYDREANATRSLERAVERLQKSTVVGEKSLREIYESVLVDWKTETTIAGLQTSAQVNQAISDLTIGISKKMQYVMVDGENSVRRQLVSALPFARRYNIQLREVTAAELQRESVDRARISTYFTTMMNGSGVPNEVALNDVLRSAFAELAKSPWATALGPDSSQSILSSAQAETMASLQVFANKQWDRLRKSVIIQLEKPASPWFLGKTADGVAYDFETLFLTKLSSIVKDHSSNSSVRISALETFLTYHGARGFASMKEQIQTVLEGEQQTADTDKELEAIEAMLALL